MAAAGAGTSGSGAGGAAAAALELPEDVQAQLSTFRQLLGDLKAALGAAAGAVPGGGAELAGAVPDSLERARLCLALAKSVNALHHVYVRWVQFKGIGGRMGGGEGAHIADAAAGSMHYTMVCGHGAAAVIPVPTPPSGCAANLRRGHIVKPITSHGDAHGLPACRPSRLPHP